MGCPAPTRNPPAHPARQPASLPACLPACPPARLLPPSPAEPSGTVPIGTPHPSERFESLPVSPPLRSQTCFPAPVSMRAPNLTVAVATTAYARVATRRRELACVRSAVWPHHGRWPQARHAAGRSPMTQPGTGSRPGSPVPTAPELAKNPLLESGHSSEAGRSPKSARKPPHRPPGARRAGKSRPDPTGQPKARLRARHGPPMARRGAPSRAILGTPYL